MRAFLTNVLLIVRCRLRSQVRLRAENLVLRRQLLILSRKRPARVRLRNLDRLILVWLCLTSNPTDEWIAGQVREAFPWDEAPRHLLRDRDGSFGLAYTRRIRAMGIHTPHTTTWSALIHR